MLISVGGTWTFATVNECIPITVAKCVKRTCPHFFTCVLTATRSLASKDEASISLNANIQLLASILS